MNTSLRTPVGGVAIAFVLLLAPAIAHAKPVDRYKMTFEVDGNRLALKKNIFYTSRSNCKSKNHDACYDVPEDHSAEFSVTLQQGDSTCRKDSSWKIHSVVLGGESDVTNPAAKPTTWGNISQDAADDFSADRTSGEVKLTEENKKKVTFSDANEHVFSIWYKVVVEHCGSGRKLSYDPRIDNRGSPGN